MTFFNQQLTKPLPLERTLFNYEMSAIAALLSVPLGILRAIYLSELGKTSARTRNYIEGQFG